MFPTIPSPPNFFQKIGAAISKFLTKKVVSWTLVAATVITGVKGFRQMADMLAKGQDIMANKTAAGGKIPVIYGTRRVGAQIVYMDTAQNRSKDLFVVYAISVGECEEILGRTIEIDGNSILDGNIYKGGGYVGSDKISSGNGSLNTASQVGDVQYSNAGTLGTDPTLRYSFVFNLHHGASSQTADPMLRASIPTEWTTNHKLNGICYIAAAFDYDKKGMYKGVPQITVQVKGKKVYDPRTDTTAWSSNPALCFLDYIQNDEYGKGLATSQINMTTISAAANKCDTLVDQPYYNGNYQDVTWSGDSGDDFIVIDDNADWWQNKVDEVIDIRDASDTVIFDGVDIKGTTRYEFYDATQENRLYIDGTLSSSYTNEAGSAKAQVKRFHCNGYIDTNKNVMDNAKELLANMRGILNYVNGKYELQIEDTGSSTFSITDNHIIADAGISVDYGNKDKKANKVVIEFFNANKKYELDTATVLHDATPEYYSDDGEVLEIKAEFPYVTDPYIAYNMGKAILTRSRNQTTMQFLGTPEMYKLNVGDIVDLTYSGLGFSGKVCRVEALELQANGLVSVSLIEYFDVYTWEVPAQESVEILAKIPTIGALKPPQASSIVFTDTDASSINRPTLTWTEPTDFPVRQYRVDVVDSSDNNVFSKIVDTPSVDLSFLPKAADYEASITSFNGVGIESNASTKTFTIADDPVKTTEVEMNGVTLSTVETYGTVSGKTGNFVNFTNKVNFEEIAEFENGLLVDGGNARFENPATFVDGFTGQGTFEISQGSIQFGSYTPATTTNNLYNVGGSLYWNGQALGTGTGDITAVVAGTNLNGGGTSGSVTLNLDSTITGDHTFSNNIVIQGNLDVQGTTTTIDTTNLDVADKNITLNYSTGDSSASANGAGITIQDAVSSTEDATLTWNTANDSFNFSHDLNFADSIKAQFGTNNDLQIQHTGSNSSILHNGTGNLNIQNSTNDTDLNLLNDDGSGGTTTYFKLDGSLGYSRALQNIRFDDNVKATFGTGNDLRIYHDGSNSYINDLGDGFLKIGGASQVEITNNTNTEQMAVFKKNGAVELYYDNAEKLATSSGGIDVSGTVTADGLTVDGNILLNVEGNELQFNTSSTPVNKIYTDDTYTTNGLTISADNGVALKSTNNYLLLDDTGTNEMVLNVDGGERMRVTSTGIDVTGTIESTGFISVEGTSGNTGAGTDRWIGGDGTSGTWFYNVPTGSNHYFAVNNSNTLGINSSGIDVTGTVTFDGGTTSANLNFGDGDKAVFGASSDLQIYHNGTHSYIDDAGTGKLILRGNTDVEIHKYTGEYMITANADGAVTLYHDDSPKIATTSTGIDVTGNIELGSSHFMGDEGGAGQSENLYIKSSENNDVIIRAGVDSDSIRLQTSATDRFTIDAGGVGYWNGTSYIDSARNLSNLGTISSGAITSTSSITAASGGNVIQLGTDGNIEITRTSGGAYIDFKDSSSEDYDQRIQATSTGHNFSGTITSTGLTIDNEYTLPSTSGSAGQVLKYPATGSQVIWADDDTEATTINNNADNRIITGSGTANTLNAEANFTYDGSKIITTSNSIQGTSLTLANTNAGGGREFTLLSNATGNFYIYDDTADATRFEMNSSGYAKFHSGINVVSDISINATQVITSSRNLVNIASISSGAITTSGFFNIHASHTVYAGMITTTSTSTNSYNVIRFSQGSGSGAPVGLIGTAGSAVGNTAFRSGMNIGTQTSGSLNFIINDGYAGKFDTSKNLLVGKTSAALAGAGTAILSTGTHNVTVDGDTTLQLNRLTSDGNLITFYKDTSTVGSIGTVAGRFYIGNDDTFITFKGSTDTIYPATATGGPRDNAISLGDSGTRFKDLYLSGTISSGAITSSSDIKAAGDIWVNYNASGNEYLHLNYATGGDGGILFRHANALKWQQTATTGSGQPMNWYSYDASNTVMSLSSAGLLTTDSGYQVNGTTVIDSSRNLTNIGTISSGDITITDTSADPFLKLETSERSYVIRIDNSDSDKFQIRDTTSSTTRLTLDSSGRFGIGTDSPSAVLEVEGSPVATGDTRYELVISEDNTASAGRGGGLAFARQGVIYGGIKTLQDTASDSNASMYFQTVTGGSNTTKMTIDSAGRVGIGTTNPSVPLHIETLSTSGTGTPTEVLRLQVTEAPEISDLVAGDGTKLSFYVPEGNQTTQEGAAIAALRESSSDVNAATSLTFYTAGDDTAVSEAMRLDSSQDATFAGTIQNGSVWINDGTNYNNYNENIRLFNPANNVSVIAFSATGTGGIPTSSILGYSDRFETRLGSTWKTRVYSNGLYVNGGYYVGTTRVIDPSRNLVNIGTISSGAITSSGDITLSGANDDLIFTDKSSVIQFGASGTNTAWSAPKIWRSSSNYIAISDYSGVELGGYNGTAYGARLRVEGNGDVNIIEGGLEINGTSVVDSSRNLTNIGTISSGAITTSGGFTATIGGIHVADGVTFGQGDHFLGDEGGQNDSETLLLRNGASTSGNSGIKILAGYNDGGDTSGKIQLYTNGSTSSPKLEIDIDGNIKMGSTQIISGGSRNLTNIGTITASGKITSTELTITGGTDSEDIYINNTSPTLGFTDSNSFSDSNDVYLIRGASTGKLQFQFKDDSAGTTTQTFLIDQSGNTDIAGTISSGAITANHSKSSTANPILTLKNTSTTNEGRYLQFTDNAGSFVGQIGKVDQTESNIFISTFDTGLKFESYITYKAILPCGTDGADVDNIIDLGSSSVRFDDIYATNGTIQTSDRNEKQDIQALTEAEQRVATSCKGLIRRFRWQDSVAEKDDNPDSNETARYHFGVIAQDLQDAFTAEGLDAGDYGMFISSTWTDDEGNEQTRLGVRYNELLAFIISTL